MVVRQSRSDREPVTVADVQLALRVAAGALGEGPAAAWSNEAGRLEWDCWETVEHIADSLFAYAFQLTPATPRGGYIPIATMAKRPGAPERAILVEREQGPANLLLALEACGALLVAMLETTPPTTRAWHPQGTSDPEGFAAMGVTEILVHGHDAAQGHRVPFEPPADLCQRVLHRLFPPAPPGPSPWSALLWATGRAEVPGRGRLDEWRWYSEPQP